MHQNEKVSVRTLRRLVETLLIFALLSPVALAQEISLRPSTMQAGLGQSVFLDVVVNMPTVTASGFSVAISLPAGLSIVGESTRAWYTQKWRDVSIEPRTNGAVLYLAAALKGADSPCAGECPIARIEVTSSSASSYTIPFVTSETIAMNSEKEEILFQAFSSATIVFGTSTSQPGDTDSDGVISDTEAITAIVNWLNGDSESLSDVDAITLITLWLRGGCYQAAGSGFESISCTE